jgi:hypothetical protein
MDTGKNEKRNIFTAEKIYEFAAYLEINPRKSSTRLAPRPGKLGCTHTAARRIKLRPRNITVARDSPMLMVALGFVPAVVGIRAWQNCQPRRDVFSDDGCI